MQTFDEASTYIQFKGANGHNTTPSFQMKEGALSIVVDSDVITMQID